MSVKWQLTVVMGHSVSTKTNHTDAYVPKATLSMPSRTSAQVGGSDH